MDYSASLYPHFRPQKGWINDPNGLVYFQGYYHVFYQHAPHFEAPWHEAMHWGHARTKDFLTWEELPIALAPDRDYDRDGCWSGTAIVKDDTLYLFYASIHTPEGAAQKAQQVSVACSTDGIHFIKYEGNPVIDQFPADGSADFRDPAVLEKDGKYYLIMATGHPETNTARLLTYESQDLLHWHYVGITMEWENGIFAECPSFLKFGDEYLLSASVCRKDSHFFRVMIGDFDGKAFHPRLSGEVDLGPDQYAGQAFTDHLGRALLMAWIPGWSYSTFADRSLGCMSVPRELTVRDGQICGYPVEKVRHLLRDSDPAVERTGDGFIIRRQARHDVVFKGDIQDLKILRDQYIVEVFINGGQQIVSAVLC